MNIMRELWSMVPQGHCLPATTFFKPLPEFFEWIRKHYDKNEVIYDIGAGRGHVVAGLVGFGYKAIGLDLNYRDYPLGPVEIANAVLYEYLPDSVVMICRPCHGTFVEAVIERAIECGIKEVVYIGLDRNVEGDLGPYMDQSEKTDGPFGKDGEHAWVINYGR